MISLRGGVYNCMFEGKERGKEKGGSWTFSGMFKGDGWSVSFQRFGKWLLFVFFFFLSEKRKWIIIISLYEPKLLPLTTSLPSPEAESL